MQTWLHYHVVLPAAHSMQTILNSPNAKIKNASKFED